MDIDKLSEDFAKTSKQYAGLKPSEKAEMDELANKVDIAYMEMTDRDVYLEFLSLMARINVDYSAGNLLRIFVQSPNAVEVQTYDGWKAKKRRVKANDEGEEKGKKGIKLYHILPENKKMNRKKEQQEQQEQEQEQQKTMVTHDYVVGHVYDFSHTEGKPIKKLRSVLGHYNEFMQAILNTIDELKLLEYEEYEECEADKSSESTARQTITPHQTITQKISINYDIELEGKNDLIFIPGMSATIREGLSEEHNLSAYIHLLVSAKIHKEHEAMENKKFIRESVSYVICKHFGILPRFYDFEEIHEALSNVNIEEAKRTTKNVIGDVSAIACWLIKNLTTQYETICCEAQYDIAAYMEDVAAVNSEKRDENSENSKQNNQMKSLEEMDAIITKKIEEEEAREAEREQEREESEAKTHIQSVIQHEQQAQNERGGQKGSNLTALKPYDESKLNKLSEDERAVLGCIQVFGKILFDKYPKEMMNRTGENEVNIDYIGITKHLMKSHKIIHVVGAMVSLVLAYVIKSLRERIDEASEEFRKEELRKILNSAHESSVYESTSIFKLKTIEWANNIKQKEVPTIDYDIIMQESKDIMITDNIDIVIAAISEEMTEEDILGNIRNEKQRVDCSKAINTAILANRELVNNTDNTTRKSYVYKFGKALEAVQMQCDMMTITSVLVSYVREHMHETIEAEIGENASLSEVLYKALK